MLAAFLTLVLQFNNAVQVNGEGLPVQNAPITCKKGYDVMSKVMRDRVLYEHNTRRSLLAVGEVVRSLKKPPEKFPQASNMRRMQYSCYFEKKAREDILEHKCKKIPPRITFNDTERNYRYINARFQNFIRSRSPEQALAEATKEWWDLHWYNYNFTGVMPQQNDYPTIPFFLMANAATEKVGCAVDLCPLTTGLNNAKKYYFVLCYYEANGHVKVGEPLYMEGRPCSECPAGYECDSNKILCQRIRK